MRETTEPDDKPEREKSFWAGFTAADMRTLVVTVAGTVVGGILLVMVVAVAIILVRYEDRPIPVTSFTPRPPAKYVPEIEHQSLHHKHVLLFWVFGVFFAFSACVYASTRMAAMAVTSRKGRPPSSRDLWFLRVMRVSILTGIGSALVFVLLVLLGDAVGVK